MVGVDEFQGYFWGEGVALPDVFSAVGVLFALDDEGWGFGGCQEGDAVGFRGAVWVLEGVAQAYYFFDGGDLGDEGGDSSAGGSGDEDDVFLGAVGGDEVEESVASVGDEGCSVGEFCLALPA